MPIQSAGKAATRVLRQCKWPSFDGGRSLEKQKLVCNKLKISNLEVHMKENQVLSVDSVTLYLLDSSLIISFNL